MKPGFKTTEFIFTVVFLALSVLYAVVGELKDPMWAGVASAVVIAAYNVARGLAKQNGASAPDALTPEKLPPVK